MFLIVFMKCTLYLCIRDIKIIAIMIPGLVIPGSAVISQRGESKASNYV